MERIINPTYLKDPHYLVFAEDVCGATGEVYPVEIGFANNCRGGGIRTVYYEDERLKQLRYESEVVYHKPFSRVEADETNYKQQNKPTVQRKAAPRLRMGA